MFGFIETLQHDKNNVEEKAEAEFEVDLEDYYFIYSREKWGRFQLKESNRLTEDPFLNCFAWLRSVNQAD